MRRVFVSYSYEDQDTAKALAEGLRIVGISTEPSFETPGQELVASLRAAIRSVAAVIILVSERALKSQWVMFEMGVVFGNGKPVVPVLVGDEDVALPPWLLGTKAVDARHRSMPEVVAEVVGILEGGSGGAGGEEESVR